MEDVRVMGTIRSLRQQLLANGINGSVLQARVHFSALQIPNTNSKNNDKNNQSLIMEKLTNMTVFNLSLKGKGSNIVWRIFSALVVARPLEEILFA